MEIDRRAFITSLGGSAAVALMTNEQKADALEHYLEEQLNEALGGQNPAQAQVQFPKMADIEAQNDNLARRSRRGAGSLFVAGSNGQLKKLEKMPAQPTLLDFFKYRFDPANHVLQSANRALKNGMREEIILACLLHDVVLNMIHPDHGWWGAQLVEPYVPEITTFAIRYHQTLRFYPDSAFGYEYPEMYFRMFGEDYTPEPYIQRTYEYVRKHKWYEHPRLVTVNDLYSFDASAKVSIDPFVDIIGRHFKQPKEGLGWDNTASSHMWRTMIFPDRPL